MALSSSSGPLRTPPFAHQRTVINSFSGAADDDPSYVLSLSGDATGRLAAVAGSEFDLKLYDRATLQPLGALGTPAHAGRINEICFGGAAAPGLLYSASSDHSVRVWDCASAGAAGPVATLHDRREEVFCLSASAGHLLAAGTQSAVLIWDTRRAGKPLCRWEVHTDEVTQVCFPTNPNPKPNPKPNPNPSPSRRRRSCPCSTNPNPKPDPKPITGRGRGGGREPQA